jgi:hypothetical protein
MAKYIFWDNFFMMLFGPSLVLLELFLLKGTKNDLIIILVILTPLKVGSNSKNPKFLIYTYLAKLLLFLF